MTSTLEIISKILKNYSWTRLAVMIIEAASRQFFHTVTYACDDSNLSLETFATDTWRTVVCSLGHGCKRMLASLPTFDQCLMLSQQSNKAAGV